MELPWHDIALIRLRSRRALTASALLGVLVVALRIQESPTGSHVRIRSLQSEPDCTIECCGQHESILCASEPENSWINALPVPVQWILIVFLVVLSAIFSGLTLGMLGLDVTGLEIVMEGDDVAIADAAKKIYPIRKKGNRLLCTLILGNVAVNSLLSILLADKAGGLIGFVVSTVVIVLFGEIIPQAICSRYALEIGSRLAPLVKVIMFLFWPLAAPLAWGLDKALGDELATTYSPAEMKKLLQIHVAEGRFDQETAEAMKGALAYKEILVGEVMTPIDRVFMLNVDERLGFECIARIFKTGYSRIPVYEVSRNNIIGILFTKDLIFVDPEDETPLRNFVSIFGRGAHLVWPDMKLGDVLRELKQGRSHLAIVRDVNNEDESQDPFYEIKGIITLEDIIEEIIGDEIVDETDAFVDRTHSVKVNRLENFDWGRLRLLDSKIVDERLSYEETKAVTAHLRTNYGEAVSLLSDNQLYRLVSETSVSELQPVAQKVGSQTPSDLVYEKGVPTDECTLILSGKMTVLAGFDEFRSDVSSWTVLASAALTELSYVPDFTAFVSGGPCRCLRFTRERYTTAVDASAMERRTAHEASHHEDQAQLDLSTMRRQQESTHGFTASDLSGAEISPTRPSTKVRATQVRRNKLIAAFQKANKKSIDENENGPVAEGDDTSRVPTPDEEEARQKSVRFFGPSDNTPLSDDIAHLQRSTPDQAPDTEDETAHKTVQDAASGSRRPFQYIGSPAAGPLGGDPE